MDLKKKLSRLKAPNVADTVIDAPVSELVDAAEVIVEAANASASDEAADEPSERESGIRSRLLDLAKRKARPRSKAAQATSGLIGRSAYDRAW